MEEGTEPVRLLVGCKADREEERQVSQDEARTRAIQLAARWTETSAKTGANVEAGLNLTAGIFK